MDLSWSECSGLSCITSFLGFEWVRGTAILTGVLVAILSVLSAKNIARKKQTADLLLSNKSDQNLVSGLRCLSKIYKSENENVQSFADSSKAETDEAKNIRHVLNHWEHISVGIQAKIYDEGMLHRAAFNTLISLHQHARPFIEKIRADTQRPTVYQEVEWLAGRWSDRGAPRKNKGSLFRRFANLF